MSKRSSDIQDVSRKEELPISSIEAEGEQHQLQTVGQSPNPNHIDLQSTVSHADPKNEIKGQETQPLVRNEEQPDKLLHIDPPERIVVNSQTRFRIRLLGLSWSGKTREPLCARANFEPYYKRGLYTEIQGWTTSRSRASDQRNVLSLNWLFNWEGKQECYMPIQRRYTHNHIVVGIMNKWTGIPRECLVQDIPHQHLFHSIRKATRQLRPWWKRALSLKSVQGFSMYECFPYYEYHRTVDLDQQTENSLTELFHDFTRRNVISELRWLPWIQQNFNQGDSESEKAHYALQIVLRWSITKLVLYGLTPVLLSLAIGFWFQYTQEGDKIAVVQTAWTISSFIIGGASLLIAIMAAITQLGGT